MKANVGNTEKVIRIIIAIVLFSMWFFLEGNMRYIALVGIIPLVTALFSFCPLWTVFGINTCKKQ
ncbi:MAG: DUF2892 domain-containing protein [Deferribacteres bacterium]|nr:DUF2892 domain-containing protein [candidate division KSB1 bacterium]MCB9500423.1 DUF2892 domain-containing protein [Deferribacteres bacterium]